MVGRAPPPPPPPRRWWPLILAVAVAAVLAATAVVVHPWRTAPPSTTTVNAAIAPGAQPTSYRTTVSLGTDITTGAPLTIDIVAATPAELQARVDELQANIVARRAEGCVAVKLKSGGYAWLLADVAARQAVMMESGKAQAEATNRAFEADRQRRQAEIEAENQKLMEDSARQAADLQATIDAIQARQTAAEKKVNDEIAAIEAETLAIWNALLDAAATEEAKANVRRLLITHRDRASGAHGERISFEDEVRRAGLAAHWPQFSRFVELIRHRDALQSHGVSDLLGGTMSAAEAEHPRDGTDGRPIVWKEDAPAEQRPLTYTGPGEVLANGDVRLGGGTGAAAPQQRALAHRPPQIPDPIGLGARLVLIDVLVERFGEKRAGLIDEKAMGYDALVELYWAKVYLSGKPSPYPESPSTP